MLRKFDFVFEGRNKEYGAYLLRKKYPRNVLTGAVIAILLLVILVKLPAIAELFEDTAAVPVRTVVFTPLPEPPPLPEAPPKSGGAKKAEKKPAAEKAKPDNIPKPEPVEEDQTDLTEDIRDSPEASETGQGDPGENIMGSTGKTDGMEGANGEQGGSMNGAREFVELYYIKVPGKHALMQGAVAEVIFRADVEESIRDGKIHSGKFISPNNPQVVNLTNQGFLHHSHMQSFVLVNDSTAVNIRAIRRTDKKEIVLKDGRKIILQKEYADLFRERLQAYSETFSGDSIVLVVHPKKKKRFRYIVKTDPSQRILETEPAEMSDRLASRSNADGATGISMVTGASMKVDAGWVGEKMSRIQLDRQVQDLQAKVARRKEEERLEKERREEFDFPRPYGTPDKTIKIDHTMIIFRNVAEVLGGGRVAGVMVSGDNIFIRSGGVTVNPQTGEARGGLSMGAGEGPLFLLDGIPSTKEVIMSLPMGMIAAIDILKSPNNTAFYGARGANGVIAVFTRKASVD